MKNRNSFGNTAYIGGGRNQICCELLLLKKLQWNWHRYCTKKYGCLHWRTPSPPWERRYNRAAWREACCRSTGRTDRQNYSSQQPRARRTEVFVGGTLSFRQRRPRDDAPPKMADNLPSEFDVVVIGTGRRRRGGRCRGCCGGERGRQRRRGRAGAVRLPALQGRAGGWGRRERAGPGAAGDTCGDSRAAPRLRLRLQGQNLLSCGGDTEMRVVRGCDGRGISVNPGTARHPLGVSWSLGRPFSWNTFLLV